VALDEQTGALAQRLARLGSVDYAHVTAAQYRELFWRMMAEASGPAVVDATAVVHRTRVVVPGPTTADIALDVYRPHTAARAAPAVVVLHGGGWVVGGPGVHDPLCRAVSSRTGAVTVGVDYRTAPEHRFPAALHDCLAALDWVAAHAGRLGADPARLAVAGDSAGANLAAAVTLAVRDGGGPPLAAQALLCPFVDLRAGGVTDGGHDVASLLSPAAARWFCDQYLGAHDPGDPLASPLCAADLAGLPPAVVATAGHDPLRAQGRAYAGRLRRAGVEVRALDFPALAHGFAGLGAVSEASARAADQVWDALGRLLGTPQPVGGSSARRGATCHPADDTLRGS